MFGCYMGVLGELIERCRVLLWSGRSEYIYICAYMVRCSELVIGWCFGGLLAAGLYLGV